MCSLANEDVISNSHRVIRHFPVVHPHRWVQYAVRRNDACSWNNISTCQRSQNHRNTLSDGNGGWNCFCLLAICCWLGDASKISTQLDTCHHDGLASQHDVLLALNGRATRYLVAGILWPLINVSPSSGSSYIQSQYTLPW